MCVYTGSKHTTCVKSPLTLAPAPPGSQPHTLKTSTTPPWLLCTPSFRAPQCSRDPGGYQTSFHYPVYRISPQSLSLRLSLIVSKPAKSCRQDWWSAPPSWSSTNSFQPIFVYSFFINFYTSQFKPHSGKYFITFCFYK